MIPWLLNCRTVRQCATIPSMSLSPEHQQLILDAINERMRPASLTCPLSGDAQWTLQGEIVVLPMSSSPQDHPLSSKKALPLAVLTCETCGYTAFVNLFKLGLGDALNIQESKDG